MATSIRFPFSLAKAELVDEIATIAICRADHHNSINPVVIHQLHEVFTQSAADPRVKGIVIAGEGNAFVVGVDIRFFLRNIESGDISRLVDFTKAGHRLLNAIDHCPKPVVARVNGAALGAGAEIALACDRIVASSRASFGFPETGLGIYPGFGGTQRTRRAVGVGLAKWLILSGKTLSAADALTIGLIDHVVPHEHLETAGRNCLLGRLQSEKPKMLPQPFAAIARFFERSRAEDLRNGTADAKGNSLLIRAMKSVATRAPIALQLSERLIEEGAQRTMEDGLQMEIDHLSEIFRTEDARLGLTFCSQMRIGQPNFLGK